MLGLDPSISFMRFSGLRCASPENDGRGHATGSTGTAASRRFV